MPSIQQTFPPLADIINSLLTPAMCYEQLKEFNAAENWYRTLINEYSRSRYVAKAYVKLARIYRQRMNPIWQEAMIFYVTGIFSLQSVWAVIIIPHE